jgi:uncharacterized protein YbjT (DUF2867 family)
MRILVLGGAGHVGSEVIKQLVKRGASVRALVRKQVAVTKMPEGVEVIQGDLLDPVSVRKALDGVDKLYLLNAVAPDELTQGLIHRLRSGEEAEAQADRVSLCIQSGEVQGCAALRFKACNRERPT